MTNYKIKYFKRLIILKGDAWQVDKKINVLYFGYDLFFSLSLLSD